MLSDVVSAECTDEVVLWLEFNFLSWAQLGRGTKSLSCHKALSPGHFCLLVIFSWDLKWQLLSPWTHCIVAVCCLNTMTTSALVFTC